MITYYILISSNTNIAPCVLEHNPKFSKVTKNSVLSRVPFPNKKFLNCQNLTSTFHGLFIATHFVVSKNFTAFLTSQLLKMLLYLGDKNLRRRSEVGRLLELRVRISPRAWMSVPCHCCVLSRWRFLNRADPSSREALPTMVCHCV
jgi:hypothetical protein